MIDRLIRDRIANLLLLPVFCLPPATFPVNAHEEITAHSCPLPVRPGRITSQWELENYHVQLEIFERCMFEYVKDQQRQAQHHENAAQQAMQEWKSYLRMDR